MCERLFCCKTGEGLVYYRLFEGRREKKPAKILTQLSRWLASHSLADDEAGCGIVPGWHGYMWYVVARAVESTAKFSDSAAEG